HYVRQAQLRWERRLFSGHELLGDVMDESPQPIAMIFLGDRVLRPIATPASAVMRGMASHGEKRAAQLEFGGISGVAPGRRAPGLGAAAIEGVAGCDGARPLRSILSHCPWPVGAVPREHAMRASSPGPTPAQTGVSRQGTRLLFTKSHYGIDAACARCRNETCHDPDRHKKRRRGG